MTGETKTIDKPRLQLISHASISFDTPGISLWCDPWFSGEVFNQSWKLLVQPNIKVTQLAKISHLWISHEHPDHLHFPSLKKIREQHSGDITCFYRYQKNKNVIEALRKIGFQVEQLPPHREIALTADLSLYSFPQGSDCALLYRYKDTWILNQNDCLLNKSSLNKINHLSPKLDAWLFQFSLAGYCANEDDELGLKKAQNKHLDEIHFYATYLKPKIYVPFASFIYFCKQSNCYLNRFAIDLEEVLKALPSSTKGQILQNGQSLNWQLTDEARFDHNQKSLTKWRKAQNKTKSYRASQPVEQTLLLEKAAAFTKDVQNFAPSYLRPQQAAFFLTDLRTYLILNFDEATSELKTYLIQKKYLAGKLPSEEMLFFLANPWGADTLNITGSFYIDQVILWKWICYIKHCMYIYQGPWAKKYRMLIPVCLSHWRYIEQVRPMTILYDYLLNPMGALQVLQKKGRDRFACFFEKIVS